MKTYFFLGLFCTIAGVAESAESGAPSTRTPSPEGDRNLQEQVQTLQQTVAELRTEYQASIAALIAQVQQQQAMIETLTAGASTTAAAAVAPTPASTAFPTTDESVVAVPKAQTADTARSASLFPTTDEALVGFGADYSAVRPAPTTTSGGATGSYLNVSFGAAVNLAVSSSDDLASLEVGDHDPQQRGFNLRNQELALYGAVDPYFEGFANIVFKLDNLNETSTEVEEAFVQTTSLPAGLQVKAGQFFAPFGRINPTHPHTWDFVDAPLVTGRFLGPDGFRGGGAQVACLAPWSWYSQFIVAGHEGRGGTAYSFRNPGEDDEAFFFNRPTIDRDVHGVSDFAWTGRWENSFDLSPTQTVVLGASAAVGPNDTGEDSSTQLHGLDFFYKWKPADAFGGWPFVKWQTELFWRRYEAGRGADDEFPVAEVFHDRGLYSQLIWGFAQRWTAGLRGDWLENTESAFTDDPTRQDRTRASTALTWFPTEFSKMRLQYNHDWLHADTFRPTDSADSLFLQTEFVIGAHGAHKF